MNDKTYEALCLTYKRKASSYTAVMCKAAIDDCHAALASLGMMAPADYKTKIWCEIDAMRDRQMALNKDTLEGRWHIRSNGQPLDTED